MKDHRENVILRNSAIQGAKGKEHAAGNKP